MYRKTRREGNCQKKIRSRVSITSALRTEDRTVRLHPAIPKGASAPCPPIPTHVRATLRAEGASVTWVRQVLNIS